MEDGEGAGVFLSTLLPEGSAVVADRSARATSTAPDGLSFGFFARNSVASATLDAVDLTKLSTAQLTGLTTTSIIALTDTQHPRLYRSDCPFTSPETCSGLM